MPIATASSVEDIALSKVADVTVSEADCDLAYVPTLALIAAIAALFDLAINRLGVVAATQLSTPSRALIVQSWGRFPLHLLGLSGLGALYFVLVRYLRMSGYSGIMRRLALATVSGVLLPAIAVSIFYPREYVHQSIVFLLVLSGHLVIAIVAGNAVRFRASEGTSRERRVVFAAWMAGLVALTLLVMITVRARFLGLGTYLALASQALRVTGEFSWLLVPWVALPMFQSAPAPSEHERPRDRVSRVVRALVSARPGVVALISLVVLIAANSALAWELRPHVSRLVYSGFRVAVLTERMAIFYLVWVSANLSIGVGLMAHTRASTRQMGAAVILWTCAGFGPRAPAQALCLCLAVLLVSRVVQSVSVQGRKDAARPWGNRPF